jgi:magnesium transporter
MVSAGSATTAVHVRSLARVIRIWRYRDDVHGHDEIPSSALGECLDPEHAVVWIDGEDITPEERDLVRQQLRVGPTVIDALTNPKPERTKLMRYGDYFHVAVHDCELADAELESREIDIVTGPGWILTIRHATPPRPPVDVDEVMHRFELQRTEHSTTDQGFLLWALFDLVIDRYLDVIYAVDEQLDEVEERVFDDTQQTEVQQGVFALRRVLVDFRRAAAPMREVLDAITRKEVPFVGEDALVHFRDLADRMLRVLDFIESQRDLLTGLLEADLAVISNRINEIMKKMTSWGAILLGSTLIAGIYGMNFRHMPELDWAFGYPMALALMAALTIVLYRMFKRRDWL